MLPPLTIRFVLRNHEEIKERTKRFKGIALTIFHFAKAESAFWNAAWS